MIYEYTFADGEVFQLYDKGLSVADIWKLEEIHGECIENKMYRL